ncbi:hypothetical protein BSZ32_07045 [Rubritalea profundi]|uniref:Uncharacterized protein n=1 Tax=Rubritalea profundi TaxID=1658618 RepID=A0A2S7U1B7_9BACT|nr:hypothetical protein BSZ32_07045 [Rubritalea profundi]
MSSPPKSRKAWWVTLGVTFCLFAFLLFLGTGRTCGGGARIYAINNGKQLSTALFSYASDHDGMYPNEQTAMAEFGEPGDTAEACFT